MVWSVQNEREFAIFKEIDSEKDRGAALIAAAFIDDRLATAIRGRFRSITETLAREIFKGYGPLSDFKARIDIAYAMTVIGDGMRDDLHLIRRIRNRFAHQKEAIEFVNPEIDALCRKLCLPERVTDYAQHNKPPPDELPPSILDIALGEPHETPRDRYLWSTHWVLYCLLAIRGLPPSVFLANRHWLL